MARYPEIHQNPSPNDGTKGELGHIPALACVLHLTYGHVGGDEQVFLYGVGIHFYVWQTGFIEQFYDTENECWGCNGANREAVQIEFEGEGPLNDEQIEAGGRLIKMIAERESIPLSYLDPGNTARASVHVNDGNYRGFISHYNVQTDDNSEQHTDAITLDEWKRMIAGADAPADDNEDDEMQRYSTTDNAKTTYYREARGYLIALSDPDAYRDVVVNKAKVEPLGGFLNALAWNASTKAAFTKMGVPL